MTCHTKSEVKRQRGDKTGKRRSLACSKTRLICTHPPTHTPNPSRHPSPLPPFLLPPEIPACHSVTGSTMQRPAGIRRRRKQGDFLYCLLRIEAKTSGPERVVYSTRRGTLVVNEYPPTCFLVRLMTATTPFLHAGGGWETVD